MQLSQRCTVQALLFDRSCFFFFLWVNQDIALLNEKGAEAPQRSFLWTSPPVGCSFTTMYGACLCCMVNRCIALLFTNCPRKFPSMQLKSSSLVRCVIEAGLSVVRCDIKQKVKVARRREAVSVRSEHPPRRSAPRSTCRLLGLPSPHETATPSGEFCGFVYYYYASVFIPEDGASLLPSRALSLVETVKFSQLESM